MNVLSWIFKPYHSSTSRPSRRCCFELFNFRACTHQFHYWSVRQWMFYCCPIASSQRKWGKHNVLWTGTWDGFVLSENKKIELWRLLFNNSTTRPSCLIVLVYTLCPELFISRKFFRNLRNSSACVLSFCNSHIVFGFAFSRTVVYHGIDNGWVAN
jgi:hypothetical protein